MSENTNKMSVFVKVAIVLVLAVAVGAVVVVKQSAQVEEGQVISPPSATSDTDKAQIPKLLDLGATKCVPCKMMAPILESLKEEYKGQFDVVFIDVWENPDASGKYGIKLIPTQIFFDAEGKELFRHEGFFSKDDILAKWKEYGVSLDKQDNPVVSQDEPSFSRWEPAMPDTRAPENICYMCDGDINPKTRVLVKTEKGEVNFCSPHCYFIMCSSMVPPKTAHADASVTDWASEALVPAVAASYVLGMDAAIRPDIKAFADATTATAEQQANGGNVVNIATLQEKEMATLCGFCDRAVYPVDACAVKVEGLNIWGCCTMCALGVAARLQKDIEVTAKDALTEEPIVVRTASGQVTALDPSTSVAWAGTKKTAEGKMVSTGCFKQAFFVNEDNLQKWVEAHPTATGCAISINQALQEKMQLTAEQISKACKIGECVPK